MPRILTPEEQDFLIEHVSAGNSIVSGVRALKINDAGIAWRTKHANPAFAKRFEQARRDGTEAMLDQAHELAMDAMRAPAQLDGTATGKPPAPARDYQMVRLGFDACLRLAGKLNPDKYGDRIQHNVTHTVDLTAILAAADARLAGYDRARIGHVIEGSARRLRGEERRLLGLDDGD